MGIDLSETDEAPRSLMTDYSPRGRQHGMQQHDPSDLSIWDKLAMTWPAKMGQAALSAFTLPGDVYAGRVNPNSDEAIRRSADLAGFVTGTPGGMGGLGSGARIAGRTATHLPMDEASRMARAKEMGFRTEETLHRGQPHISSQTEFTPDYIGGQNTSVGAAWFSDVPEVAQQYVHGPDAGMMQAYVRGKEINLTNPGRGEVGALREAFANMQKDGWDHLDDFDAFVDHITSGRIWEGGPQGQGTSLLFQNRVLRELADQGFDVVRLNDETFGIPNQSVVVFDGRNIRSPQAAFDPAQSDSANILVAGRNPVAGGGYASARSDEERR